MSETLLPSNASPHVAQFTADYLFVRQQLLQDGADTHLDMGMGCADIALSIVNDAYTHDMASRRFAPQPEIEFMSVEEAKAELGIDD